jgi:hypothetical protein
LAAKEREGEKLAHNMFLELRSLVLKRLEKNKHHETLPPECISFAGMSGSQNFEDALDRFTCGLSARMLPSLELEDYGDQVINDEKYAAFMAFREEGNSVVQSYEELVLNVMLKQCKNGKKKSLYTSQSGSFSRRRSTQPI